MGPVLPEARPLAGIKSALCLQGFSKHSAVAGRPFGTRVGRVGDIAHPTLPRARNGRVSGDVAGRLLTRVSPPRPLRSDLPPAPGRRLRGAGMLEIALQGLEAWGRVGDTAHPTLPAARNVRLFGNKARRVLSKISLCPPRPIDSYSPRVPGRRLRCSGWALKRTGLGGLSVGWAIPPPYLSSRKDLPRWPRNGAPSHRTGQPAAPLALSTPPWQLVGRVGRHRPPCLAARKERPWRGRTARHVRAKVSPPRPSTPTSRESRAVKPRGSA